jgi:hypothetical protein
VTPQLPYLPAPQRVGVHNHNFRAKTCKRRRERAHKLLESQHELSGRLLPLHVYFQPGPAVGAHGRRRRRAPRLPHTRQKRRGIESVAWNNGVRDAHGDNVGKVACAAQRLPACVEALGVELKRAAAVQGLKPQQPQQVKYPVSDCRYAAAKPVLFKPSAVRLMPLP